MSLAESQMAIDFSTPPMTMRQAREGRDQGIARATQAADRARPEWADVAYQFLESYARKHALINPEDVCDAAATWGLSAPTDQRAWGGVYRRAVNRKLISESDIKYQRRKGHCTRAFLWASNVCRKDAP